MNKYNLFRASVLGMLAWKSKLLNPMDFLLDKYNCNQIELHINSLAAFGKDF